MKGSPSADCYHAAILHDEETGQFRCACCQVRFKVERHPSQEDVWEMETMLP